MSSSGLLAATPVPESAHLPSPKALIWRVRAGLALILIAACAAAGLVAHLGMRDAVATPAALAGVAIVALIGVLAAWWVVAALAGEYGRRLSAQSAKVAHAEERLRAHENDARLQHALEIAEDEASVMRIAEQALEVVANDCGAQLLMASNPDGEIDHDFVVPGINPAARCVIRSPRQCPTVRRGQGLVYEDGMALSACRGLSGQIDAGCAAACMPIFVGGRGTGMLRTLGNAGDPALYKQLQTLAFNAHQIGTRLTSIRSVAASEERATTDPLTGLYNRRALDARLEILLEQQAPFALAMVDVDHFKKINDTWGHEAGDRALKVLAQTLRQSVRPHDLVCRFGGEEFVLLLVGMDVASGSDVLERVRAELPRVIARGNVPVFTISAGVVDHHHAATAELLVRAADALLYDAKTQGRDRVCSASRAIQPDGEQGLAELA